MLLVIEVGNTNTKIGVYDGPRLLVSWRLTTRREQTADEYGLFIETLLRTRGLAPSDIRGRPSPTWCHRCSRCWSGCARSTSR